jgi:hypothetical protein
MKASDFVLVQLANPREKFWGILKEKDATGVVIRGLTLESFEAWVREIAHREPLSVFPETVFFPLQRVERIFADESHGELLSFGERFLRLVGEDARYHLTPVPETLGDEER